MSGQRKLACSRCGRHRSRTLLVTDTLRGQLLCSPCVREITSHARKALAAVDAVEKK